MTEGRGAERIRAASCTAIVSDLEISLMRLPLLLLGNSKMSVAASRVKPENSRPSTLSRNVGMSTDASEAEEDNSESSRNGLPSETLISLVAFCQ